MDVNRYIIRQPFLSTTTATTINLPVSQTLALAGQQEIIDTKFIDVEVEKSINPIFDYETVRFTPQYNGVTCDTITYSINLLDTNGAYPPTTNWSDAGFDFDDFNFRFISLNTWFYNLLLKQHSKTAQFKHKILYNHARFSTANDNPTVKKSQCYIHVVGKVS